MTKDNLELRVNYRIAYYRGLRKQWNKDTALAMTLNHFYWTAEELLRFSGILTLTDGRERVK